MKKKSNHLPPAPTPLKNGLRGGLTAASAVCAATSVHGQEADPSETLDATVIEGAEFDTMYQADSLSSPRYTQPLLDTPQTVQVITSELIDNQGATSLRDALRNVSGISLQAGEGGAPLGDNLSIRGFSARSDFFVDGIRDLGAYSRDPFNLEQIEVAKGPAGSISGRGSTGGSINLVSKTAKLENFVESDVSIGTDNLYRGTLDVNQVIPGIEGSALRLNVMGHDNDVPDRGAAHDSRWGIATSLGFGLDEPSETSFVLNFFHMEEDNTPDFGVPWTPSGIGDPRLKSFVDTAHPDAFDNYYGVPSRDFEETSATMLTGTLEHEINDVLTVRNRTRVGQTDRLSLVTSPRFFSVDGNPVNPAQVNRGDRKDRDEQTSIVINQTDFIASFDTGSLHHDATLGFEFVHEEYDRFSRSSDEGIPTDYFNPTPGDRVSSSFYRDGSGDSFGEADTAAAYVFDTIEVTNWLELTGGIRYERFETSSFGTDSNGDKTPRRNRVDEMTSSRAGVVVKPAENGSIYFGYGQSFNPSGEFLVLNEAGRSPATFDIEPEQAESFEIGTKWDVLDNRLSLTGALFRTDKTNIRDVDPGDPTNYRLTGAAQVQGFELGVAGEITPWWQVYASYTHLDSEIQDDFDRSLIGQPLGDTPENSFSLWNHLEFSNGIFLGGGPVYISERSNNIASTRVSPAYWTVDAVAGYRVNENLTLQLNVQNLTDENYIDRMSGGHFIPGEGRSFMFTASMKF